MLKMLLIPELNLLNLAKQVQLQILVATSRYSLLHRNSFHVSACKMLLLPVLDLPNTVCLG